MNFPEYQNINANHPVFILLDDLEIPTIKNAIQQLLKNQILYDQLHDNCLNAKEIFIWEKEEEKLLLIYKELFLQSKIQ